MLDRLLKILCSLRLTVLLLSLGLMLVFIGTVAQVNEGLYAAQARYFKSWLVVGVTMFGRKLPLVLPGGYLLGSTLLVNLVAAHTKRFHFSWRKSGIVMTHFGLIMLLVGQLLTDLLSTESAMRLEEGETKNYSEDFHASELVFINKSSADEDEVVAIPESLLAAKGELRHEKLPFTVRVKDYWPNAELRDESFTGGSKVNATQGYGRNAYLRGLPAVTDMEQRNLPAALVEVVTAAGSQGVWLASSQTGTRQSFGVDGRPWELALRFQRFYKPYSLTLLDFKHERYPGTDIPKDFRSRVRLVNPSKNESREVEIFMNNPLRYAGLTFYQASFEKGDKATIFQVVKNPSYLTPYVACLIVGLGLIVQFLIHLTGFARRRMLPAGAAPAKNQARKSAPAVKK